MNKTIKIIDLLNKIANGEEVPEKIKYEGDILKYDRAIQDYKGISSTGTGSFFNYLFVNRSTSLFINDEVEIIEEPTINSLTTSQLIEYMKIIQDFINRDKKLFQENDVHAVVKNKEIYAIEQLLLYQIKHVINKPS